MHQLQSFTCLQSQAGCFEALLPCLSQILPSA